MYLLCITNLVTSTKNNPYFISQAGRLENKICQIRSQSKWGTMNKYVGSCFLLFVPFFFKFTDQSFFIIQWLYFLCITNLVTCNKNNPYFLLKVAS